MVVVYKVPAVLPDHVKAAFEERGVRLRPGDEVVYEEGRRPVVMRELDPGIIPFLRSLRLQSVHLPDHAKPETRTRHLRLERGSSEGQTA